MTWNEWIGLIASIISIIMAIWSWCNYKATRNAKNEVMDKLQLAHLSRSEDIHNKIFDTLRKCAHKQTIPRSFNTSKAVEEINKYSEEILRLLSSTGKNVTKIQEDLENIKLSLSEISKIDPKVKEQEFIKEITVIYHLILNIDGHISSLKNEIVAS